MISKDTAIDNLIKVCREVCDQNMVNFGRGRQLADWASVYRVAAYKLCDLLHADPRETFTREDIEALAASTGYELPRRLVCSAFDESWRKQK